METQAVLVESLRQYVEHPARIVFQREHYDEIVRISHEVRRASQPRFHLLLEPHVQDLAEKDVRQERRDDTPHAIDNFQWRSRVTREALRMQVRDRRRKAR